MPLPNGVDPWGRIEATCPSAEWLGNRGILHDKHGAITRAWANKAWITCALSFKGRKRKPLMQPGRYSELFFLDEATALAAGHRPCAECRRERHDAFKAAWFAANDPADESISEIDRVLHLDRLTAQRGKRTFRAPLADLPLGTIVKHDGDPFLLWRSGWLRWTPTGYEAPSAAPQGVAAADVLTPRSIVAMFRRGFVPQVHPSADT
jgi:hypothetical protein